MSEEERIDLIRRRLMQAILAVPALTMAGCAGMGEAAQQSTPTSPMSLNPTPACDDGDDDPTPAQTEGLTSLRTHLNDHHSSKREWRERC